MSNNISSISANTINFINENAKDGISISRLSSTFYIDGSYLMRRFKKDTGNTILGYTNKRRIFDSIDSLVSTDDKILKIALFNGFNGAEYYCETFRSVLGCSPSDFRKIYREECSNMDQDMVREVRERLNNLTECMKNLEEKGSSLILKRAS